MTQERINITDMQCRVYRMAQRKRNMTPTECTAIFPKFNIFSFISECYDILHLSSYDCTLRDIEEILQSNGVNVC